MQIKSKKSSKMRPTRAARLSLRCRWSCCTCSTRVIRKICENYPIFQNNKFNLFTTTKTGRYFPRLNWIRCTLNLVSILNEFSNSTTTYGKKYRQWRSSYKGSHVTVLLLFSRQNFANTIPYCPILVGNTLLWTREKLRFWVKTSISSEWELEKVGQLFQVVIHLHPCHSWQWETVNSLRAVIWSHVNQTAQLFLGFHWFTDIF